MRKQYMYQYVGENGILISPICITGVYTKRLVQLIADDGKMLTRDDVTQVQAITVPEESVNEWHEVNL